MKQFGLIISGFGGQGVLFAGHLLAYAGMIEGYHVTWVPSYGVEMRGGTAHCSVSVGEEEITSPVVEEPVAVIALNKPSLEKFKHTVIKNGIVLVNSSLGRRSVKM